VFYLPTFVPSCATSLLCVQSTQQGGMERGSTASGESAAPLSLFDVLPKYQIAADSPLAPDPFIGMFLLLFLLATAELILLASGAPFRQGGKSQNSPLYPPSDFCSY